MALLEVEDLRVEIKTGRGTLNAVRGIDLKVERGETVCLVGESGCGKSITSLAVMGLLPGAARRRAARLAFNGEDLAKANKARDKPANSDQESARYGKPASSAKRTHPR